MRRIILVGFLASLCAACNRSSPQQTAVAVRSEGPPGAPAVADYLIGQQIRFRNLTVFPVSSGVPRMQDRFITLNEGLAAGTVEVRELGADPPANLAPANQDGELPAANPAPNPQEAEAESAEAAAQPPPGGQYSIDHFSDGQSALLVSGGNDVNRLVVINRSEKPLYLMPGEIIVGGSQDRTIGRELVIQPDGKPFEVDVFCVESGRWGLRAEEETHQYLANSYAVADLSVAVQGESVEQAAEEANRGKFIASLGNLNKDARLAVQLDQDQSKVWDEVAAQNAKAGVSVQSGAFTANYADPAAVERLDAYIESMLKPVEEMENVVGVIVAIDGEVDSLDIFESTPLFKKLWPKLLKSYALDAATSVDNEGADKLCSRRAAREFLVDAGAAEISDSQTQDGIALVRRASDRLVSFAAGEPAADFNGGLGGGGFGAVHASAFAH
jgi:hypothetical protein